MIDNIIIDQEAKKSQMIIKDEEVTDTINDFLSKRKMKMEDLLNELAKENSSIEAHRKEVKAHLLRMRLLRREIKSKVAVTEEEIGEYYLKNREAYEGKEAVRIKQILILFPKGADAKTKAKLREEMDAIHKRLLNGEPFDLRRCTIFPGIMLPLPLVISVFWKRDQCFLLSKALLLA